MANLENSWSGDDLPLPPHDRSGSEISESVFYKFFKFKQFLNFEPTVITPKKTDGKKAIEYITKDKLIIPIHTNTRELVRNTDQSWVIGTIN